MKDKDNSAELSANDGFMPNIYIIRGLQVMMDYDLAAIYGYETRYFNRQVNNNLSRFDEDFRFQLTEAEFKNLMCKNLTSSWGGTRKLPYAFTEQGVYMLMTVLKGDLAVRQSKALIRMFKKMKDFVVQSQNVLAGPDILKLSIQTQNNTDEIRKIRREMVTRDEFSAVISDFTDLSIRKDFLFYNGQTVEADIAYSEIYSSARRSICIIDNYISLKTFVLLKAVTANVKVTIFSDNVNHSLHRSELEDFQHEYPHVDITLKTTGGIYHDRYIIIDHQTKTERIYHCGGSSKDGGKRIGSITRVEDVALYKHIFGSLQDNPLLQL